MPNPTLDEFMALNDELAALLAAGVPIDIGLVSAGSDAKGALERINAIVARRVSQGVSLAQALREDDPAVPAGYRGVMQVALLSGDLACAIQGRCRLAAAVDQTRHTVRLGLLYPVLLCCLAYIGIVAMCVYLTPILESFYQNQRISPRSGLQIVQQLRESLPYWVAVPPVLMLVVLLWQWRASRVDSASGASASWAFSWLPGVSRLLFWQRCANFADALAALVDSGIGMSEALPVAAGAAGDTTLAAAAQELAMRDRGIEIQGPAVRGLPPFLRWALCGPSESTNRVSALRIASGVYREAARRRAERIRIVAPLVASVVLGGTVTMLYGLALFLPVVQMYRQLAF